MKIRIQKNFLAIEVNQSKNFSCKKKKTFVSRKIASKLKGYVSYGRTSTATTKMSYAELLAITNVFSIACKDCSSIV